MSAVALMVVVASCSSSPGSGSSPLTAPTALTTPTATDTTTAPTATATDTTTAPPTGPTTSTSPSPTTTSNTVTPSGVPADMLNPAVTITTIRTSICVSGYTTTIRPPTSFTEPLKIHQIATYGYADKNLGDYEEDHVIALEIGGAPASAVNLYPEPHTVSSTDDTLENDLHRQVCAGQLSLADARLRLFTAKVSHGYSRAASTA